MRKRPAACWSTSLQRVKHRQAGAGSYRALCTALQQFEPNPVGFKPHSGLCLFILSTYTKGSHLINLSPRTANSTSKAHRQEPLNTTRKRLPLFAHQQSLAPGTTHTQTPTLAEPISMVSDAISMRMCYPCLPTTRFHLRDPHLVAARDFRCANRDSSRETSMSRGSVCNQEKECLLYRKEEHLLPARPWTNGLAF